MSCNGITCSTVSMLGLLLHWVVRRQNPLDLFLAILSDVHLSSGQNSCLAIKK